MATLVNSRFYWYTMSMNTCGDCGKALVKKTSKYCKEHTYNHRVRPSGLKYKLVNPNPTSFKKGHRPWNTDTKGLTKANSGSIKKGERRSKQTEFNSENTSGSNNPKWKGTQVGYFALHTWVKRHKKLYGKCEWCGSKSNINLANLDFEYTRELDTWGELCVKCHKAYDAVNGWGIATQKFGLGKK